MSETSENQPADAGQLPAPARRAGLLRQPALWLALVALALLGAHWYATRVRIDSLQQELARRLAEGDAVARESRVLAKQNQDLLQGLQAKVGALEARLAESQSQQVALEAMYQELSRNRDDRVLAEVEQALNLAAQQLQIGGNVEAALIALQGADARLARSESAQFLPLRKLINRDIERLKALPLVDIAGMALRLEDVSAIADALPFAFEIRPRAQARVAEGASQPPGNVVTAFVGEVWQELRKLIHIERLDRPEPGLLAPDQAYFLRENLKLRLMNARLALVQRDGKTFREDIRQALAWIERYFDLDSRSVQTAADTLRPLLATELNLALPGLEESLGAVRNFKVARERGGTVR